MSGPLAALVDGQLPHDPQFNAKSLIISFLRPFIFAIGMQVITLLLALTYVTVARRVPQTAEFILFVVWAFLFVYVLTDVVALARSIVMHGLLRVELLKNKKVPPDTSTVRDIRETHR
jgi:hypothetical protein